MKITQMKAPSQCQGCAGGKTVGDPVGSAMYGAMYGAASDLFRSDPLYSVRLYIDVRVAMAAPPHEVQEARPFIWGNYDAQKKFRRYG